MGLLTPNDIKDFRALYTLQLRYLLSTEHQIIKGLETMVSKATDLDLKDAFQRHEVETRLQVARLETIIAELNDGNVDDKKDPIVTTLIASAANIAIESDPGAVRDAGLIATAQKIEHYEIASYGSARAWAEILGLARHVDLLQQTLNEEIAADEALTEISFATNDAAASASA